MLQLIHRILSAPTLHADDPQIGVRSYICIKNVLELVCKQQVLYAFILRMIVIRSSMSRGQKEALLGGGRKAANEHLLEGYSFHMDDSALFSD